MDAVSNFFNWLFNTRPGVLALIGGGIVVALIVALILEHRTRQLYKNHKKSADDWSLFDDDEDENDSETGWSAFDEDNK